MLRNFVACVAMAGVLGIFPVRACGGEVALTVYTGRANATEKEVMGDFESETGISVVLVDGKPGELIERIVASGDAPEADLFMTVDGGLLERARREGVFAKTDSPAIRETVPAGLRDSGSGWVGLTTRARVIVYALDRVNPNELSSYAALAGPQWKGRVLVRSSTALYNQSLLASLISVYGEEAAKAWVDGMAANLAREPKGGDRDQAKAVASGVGDVAIMNSYYIGQMLRSRDAEELSAAKAVGVFFPDQDLAGTHINICGIGLVRGTKNPDAAIRLVEYLLSKPVQEKLSAGNNEFPVNAGAKMPPLLESFGRFKTQAIDFAELDKRKAEAEAIFAVSDWK